MSHGKKPELAWLPIADLSVDRSYQRTLESRRSMALIRHIAEGFRWPLFGAVTVAKGLVGYLLVDGQHRCEGARLAGITEIPAIIIDAGDAAAQARAFLGANQRRVTVNPYAIFHAELVAGDEGAERVARVAAAAGVEIPRYPLQQDRLKPTQTLAMGAIRRCAALFGEWETSQALKVIVAAANGKPGKLRADLIRATAELMKGSDADRAAAESNLMRLGIEELEGAADRERFLSGVSRTATMYAAIQSGKLPGRKGVEAHTASTKFNTPMARRCDKCPNVFKTMLVKKTTCDRCAAGAAA